MGVLGEVSNWLRLRLRRSQPDSAEFEYWRKLFEDAKIRKLRSKFDDVQTWLENLETEEDEQDECSSDDLEDEDLGSATSWRWIPELNQNSKSPTSSASSLLSFTPSYVSDS